MSDRDATVSLIVTTYNAERTLAACLKSIRLQSYRPIELLVIDNQSTDHTVEIAKGFADVVESTGPERSAQRNRGAQLAGGEYLMFIDADMTLSQDVVDDCLKASRANAAPGVIVSEVSDGVGFIAKCRALERSCYVGDDSIEAARFFTKAAFEASGGFDETLTGPEDWDLSIRIAAGSHLPRADSFITHDEGRLRLRTVLAKKRYYAASSVRYWRKHGGSTLGQANLVFRPAFVRNWRRLVRHPILTLGFLAVKSLEGAAAVLGVLDDWVRRQRDKQAVKAV
jgi:glycosyltransferase involved in cell wall biosynthesis